MPESAYRLHQYPAAMVRIACSKCPRKGQYLKGNLIVKYGADQRLPDLLKLIAQCDRHGKYDGWCGAHYLDRVGQ
jgi:hypothetical protein